MAPFFLFFICDFELSGRSSNFAAEGVFTEHKKNRKPRREKKDEKKIMENIILQRHLFKKIYLCKFFFSCKSGCSISWEKKQN